jgi:hypothetical protein
MTRPGRDMLTRLPPLATTGVGSLPGNDPAEAVRHVMTAYDVPFCPQLPCLDGDMIGEWLGVPPGRCGWSPDRDRPLPRCWATFLDAVVRTRPRHGVVKLQVTGPVTLCWALESRPSSPPALFAHDVANWLAGNVHRQIAALAEHHLDCLLVVDEPALGLVPSHSSLVRAWDPLRHIAGAWGLHVCCPPPWGLLEETEPDLVSFDLVQHSPRGVALDSLRRLVRAGTTVAWGVTPTTGMGGAESAGRLLDHAIEGLTSARIDPMELLAASVLTASCGTGAQSTRDEATVSRTLGDIAQRCGSQSRGTQ